MQYILKIVKCRKEELRCHVRNHQIGFKLFKLNFSKVTLQKFFKSIYLLTVLGETEIT